MPVVLVPAVLILGACAQGMPEAALQGVQPRDGGADDSPLEPNDAATLDAASADTAPAVDATLIYDAGVRVDAGFDAGSPGPDAAVPATGAVGDPRIWTDGCSSEVWARWTTLEDFTLVYVGLRAAAETRWREIDLSYQQPTFLAGHEEAVLLFEWDEFVPGDYELVFGFADGREFDATIELDQQFYRHGEVLSVVDYEPYGWDGLDVWVDTNVNGIVSRVRVYDESTCLVWSHTFPAWNIQYLQIGYPTKLDVGGSFNAGQELLLVAEGIDDDAEYTFYTTMDLLIP